MNSNEEREAYDRWLAAQEEDYAHALEREVEVYRALRYDLPERPGTRR